jgi:membrane associated rhomboid family serine protease
MFVPILHERMVVSQLPWVSILLIAASAVVFPFTAWSGADAESDRRFAEAVGFAVAVREVEVDPRLASPDLIQELRASTPVESHPELADLPAEAMQAEMDERTEAWLASTESAPTWRFGLVPARLRATAVVSHQFLHGDLLHLLGNLLMFYLTAPLVEDRIGRGRFLIAYLGLGALAGLAYALSYPNLFRPLIGASGAISAVVGLFVVLYSKVRLRYLLWLGLPLGVFQAKAWVMFPVWFGMQVALGLRESAATEAGIGGVAYWAHAWGFAGGVGLGLLLARRAPAIEVAAPDPLAEARKLLARGQRDEAWRKLLETLRGGDERDEAIRELWQLARLTGRSAEAAPYFARLVRRALEPGDAPAVYRAAELWEELQGALRGRPIDPALSLRLAEAFEQLDEARERREEIVADALAGLKPTTAPPVAAGLARLAAGARSRDVRAALAAARARSDLPAPLRAALGGGAPAGPA